MTDEFEKFRDALNARQPGEDARAKARAAAMAAFAKEFDTEEAPADAAPEKISPPRQGWASRMRLSLRKPPERRAPDRRRRMTRSSTFKYALGGSVAAALALIIAAQAPNMIPIFGSETEQTAPAGGGGLMDMMSSGAPQSAPMPVPSPTVSADRSAPVGRVQGFQSEPHIAMESARPAAKGVRARGFAGRPVAEQPPAYYQETGRDRFEDFEGSPVKAVAEDPVSTFSIDVDTAAYAFMRASLNRGVLPPKDAVRVEEMINYFAYDYPAPESAETPFRTTVSVTPNPWNAETKLLHIGVKGYTPPVTERPRSNLVLLIDTSGSMNAPNKLPLLIASFKLLLGSLDADDTVSIVTYAGSAGLVLEPTAASERAKIEEALTRLSAGGSTAGGAGLELAYKTARANFDAEAVNRVILATDGDFNVGFASPDAMKDVVEKERKSGVYLSVLGFGMGNYHDALMQALAQNGNGQAAYIDTLSEARKVLADEAGSALVPIAQDVKIQVEFNPAIVAEYRLIGYETRALKRENFNNDAVDAGDIGSGHTVTAIYEMTPKGSPAALIDPLRYGGGDRTSGGPAGEYAFVKIRAKRPGETESSLTTRPVTQSDEVTSLAEASDAARFSTAVAGFGQLLRGGEYLKGFTYEDAAKLATGAKGQDPYGYRAEFVNLVRIADGLDKK